MRTRAIFAAANGYRQGYHEILAPLYFVAIRGGPAFGLDRNASEAIVFFLLHALVNGTVVGDLFIASNQSFTLQYLLETSASILKKFDGELR
jgi:hypothetical protein